MATRLLGAPPVSASTAGEFVALVNRIGLATEAKELHALKEEVRAAPWLLPEQRVALVSAISARFCALNSQAAGPQRQREPGRCQAL